MSCIRHSDAVFLLSLASNWDETGTAYRCLGKGELKKWQFVQFPHLNCGKYNDQRSQTFRLCNNCCITCLFYSNKGFVKYNGMKKKYFTIVAIFLCCQNFQAQAQSRVPTIVTNGVIEAPSGSSLSKGVDISSSRKEVFSISEGTVVSSFTKDGLQTVLVKCAGSIYVYGNMATVLVSSGDVLKEGQKIGDLSRKEDDQYSLHFEAWKATSQNPVLLSYTDTKKVLNINGPN